MRILTEEHGELTENSVNYLREWLANNNNISPNQNQRKDILLETKWSSSQLRHQLRRFLNPNGVISEVSKEILRSWLIDNNFEEPKDKDREDILEKTGWNSRQLADQLRRMI